MLTDAGSVDTAGIGILGAATAQVRVTLPNADDDELAEDEVVDDVSIEHIPTGDIILEHAPEDHGAASRSDDIHDAEEVHDDAPAEDDAPADAAPADAAPAGAPEAEVPAAAEEPAPESETAAEAAPATARPAASARRSVPVGDPVPLTGAIPTTRRAAHHVDEHARGDRAHAVERVHPPQPEIALTSKRLGEFEPNRETSDLLTADRLLDRGQLSGAEPEGLWQQIVYSLSRHRINLGDSRKARERKQLDVRISAPLPGGARFVPVLSRKGGVGKTTITTLLGMALASARDDRVIAIDANPDRGTLADRIGRVGGRTVRDLARVRGEVTGFNDISTIVARDETRLDVLASDSDPRVSEAFSDRDYHDVAAVAAHYYSIVLTDTGTGIVHSVMGATLEMADELVIVAGLSVDEARLASETLTWLEMNGYAEQVRNAVVVLNNARPGTPLVSERELETHFRTRVRTVVRMPYDPLIGAGSEITFRDLQPATRQAARHLAAAVVEGLRSMAPAA
ncbi:MinD/ParA family protein [Microbacterium lushaniae]|nr:MinD/ParA family protein [Microbacterium lushaniae]KAA9159930.1 MinD/ParA family protein [Microbacterium lushaniae]